MWQKKLIELGLDVLTLGASRLVRYIKAEDAKMKDLKENNPDEYARIKREKATAAAQKRNDESSKK